MPWHGIISFAVLNVFPGCPLANWAVTCLSAWGVMAVAAKMIITIFEEAS